MISPPIPWFKLNNIYEGGNYRKDLFTTTLIHKSRLHDHKIYNIDNLVDNINTLQSTSLSINTLLLDNLHNILNLDNLYIQDKNIINTNKIIYDLTTLYKHFEFYIPLYIDWRSRIYCYSNYLSYQGTSLAKTLIINSNKTIINKTGFIGVQLYASELYGHKMKSNKKKIEWFNNNYDKIVNLDIEFIKNAVNIIEFYNLCLNMNIYNKDNNVPLGLNIHFDATCSGIQHISCLLEDVDLGLNVNINDTSNSEDPKDIYTFLINPILDKIKLFVKSNKEYYNFLNLKIDRSFIKKIVMTIPYSVTIYGIKEQICSLGTKIIMKNTKKIYYEFNSISNDLIKLDHSELLTLAKLIRTIILEYYPNLKLLFSYYGKMTALLIKLNLPILWSTPNGMITQSYLKHKEEIFTYQLNRKKHKFVLIERIKPNILDTVKSRQGIVPNVIHSMDSSHLNLIVKEFIKKELFILTIHDCFIINPNDFLFLFNSVRDKFIEIYAGKSYQEEFHNTCIETIKKNYDIEKHEDELYININNKQVPIPINPYTKNQHFFEIQNKSIYLAK